MLIFKEWEVNREPATKYLGHQGGFLWNGTDESFAPMEEGEVLLYLTIKDGLTWFAILYASHGTTSAKENNNNE